MDAAVLARRLQALKSALEDLPHQARRMARWRVRREAAKAPKFTFKKYDPVARKHVEFKETKIK